MSKLDFCTCNDDQCPLNPANHEQGCNLCVAKCLKANEIPSCYFRKVVPGLSGHSDWTFTGFAKLVLERGSM